jgi:endonuclease/exonuclease/phosphatase (EEP) superfamily protein YafD
VLWVTFAPALFREHVTVACGHWVTRRADTGHQQQQLTDDLAQLIARKAQGHRLGFWMGDTNNPDGPRDRSAVDASLRKGDLTSCWDELGQYPATEGTATLDVIGSYDPDRRVKCERARRWAGQHSDHRPVSAWYRISPSRVR